jgi:hypothetical protein
MADNDDHPSVKLPPLGNWAAQTFAYGFLLDRSASLDFSGNAAPNQSGMSGFAKPQPDDLHLLNLNPQSISFEEPLATAIAPSMGGGQFVESRGAVAKHGSIRGTTGKDRRFRSWTSKAMHSALRFVRWKSKQVSTNSIDFDGCFVSLDWSGDKVKLCKCTGSISKVMNFG